MNRSFTILSTHHEKVINDDLYGKAEMIIFWKKIESHLDAMSTSKNTKGKKVPVCIIVV